MSVKCSRTVLAAIMATIFGAGTAFAVAPCGDPCATPVAPAIVTPAPVTVNCDPCAPVVPAPAPIPVVQTNACDPCAPVAPAPVAVVQTNACDPCAPIAPPPPVRRVVKANPCNPCAPVMYDPCDPCAPKKGRTWRWFGWFRPKPRPAYYNHGYSPYYRSGYYR